MATTAPTVSDLCLRAQAAARELAVLPGTVKDHALLAIADALMTRTPEILQANARDMEAGHQAGLTSALLDRLELSEARIVTITAEAGDIATLPEPSTR